MPKVLTSFHLAYLKKMSLKYFLQIFDFLTLCNGLTRKALSPACSNLLIPAKTSQRAFDTDLSSGTYDHALKRLNSLKTHFLSRCSYYLNVESRKRGNCKI